MAAEGLLSAEEVGQAAVRAIKEACSTGMSKAQVCGHVALGGGVCVRVCVRVCCW